MTNSGDIASGSQRAAINDLIKSPGWLPIKQYLEAQIEDIEAKVFDINNPSNSHLMTIQMNFLQFLVQTRNIYKTVLNLPTELLDNTVEKVNKQMEIETEALIKKLQG